MKKWLPWIIGFIVMALLVVRIIYRHGHGVRKEHEWYVTQLHYDFSATIDSIEKPRRAFIRITGGTFDRDRERQLQNDLEFNGELRIVANHGGQLELLVPYKAEVNDSLQVNSDEDRLSLYHNGELVVSRPLSHSLQGRPF